MLASAIASLCRALKQRGFLNKTKESCMKTTVEKIDPKLAERYLTANTSNRHVRNRAVEEYARDMTNGNWILSHQGIAFDESGNLLDGQHRLLAIVRSGVTVPMAVTRGLPVSQLNGVELFTMDVIDRNRPRTTADQLGVCHQIAKANKVMAAVASLAWLCTSSRIRTTVPQALAVLDIYGDHINEAMGITEAFKPADVGVVNGSLAFVAHSHHDQTMEFAKLLASGENISKGMPVYALRNYLIAGGVAARNWTERKEAMGESVINALWYHISNQPLNMIKRGDTNLKAFRQRQRQNVEKVRQIMGYQPAIPA